MDTNLPYPNAVKNFTKLIVAATATTLVTMLGCVPTEPVVSPPSTKPHSQFFAGAETASGEAYATGYVNIPVGVNNLHTSLLLLRKYDANQQLLWERKYPDPAQSGYITAMATSLPTDNAGEFIRVTNDGSVYVLARLQKPDNYGVAHDKVNYDIALLKYSAAGNLLWTRYIDLMAKDFPRDLQIGADGNIYLQGRTIKKTIPRIPEVSPEINYFNEFVASFNSNGDTRWRVNFNASGQNIAEKMQVRSDGIYLTANVGGDACGNFYKIDFAGHLAPVSSSPLPACPSQALLAGDRAMFTPTTAGNAESTIVALNNPSSIATTIAWHDVAVSYLHADNDGYTYTELWQQLPDRLQPTAFFVLLSGNYHYAEANGEGRSESATLLVHATTSGNVLSIVPITDDIITSSHLNGGLELAQKASGDVVLSAYIENIEYILSGSEIDVVDYDSHALTHYSFAPGIWLSSISGLEAGQTPLVIGSRFVDEIWTPSIRRFDQGQ